MPTDTTIEVNPKAIAPIMMNTRANTSNLSRAGRKPGALNKKTVMAKEAIGKIVDRNVYRVQRWLKLIEEQHGPLAAFKCYEQLLEYHVPKLSRAIVTGADDGPIEIQVSWKIDGAGEVRDITPTTSSMSAKSDYVETCDTSLSGVELTSDK